MSDSAVLTVGQNAPTHTKTTKLTTKTQYYEGHKTTNPNAKLSHSRSFSTVNPQ